MKDPVPPGPCAAAGVLGLLLFAPNPRASHW
jgi:hypothetical protein